MDGSTAVNMLGSSHVYNAAAKVGIGRIVSLSTTTFFDQSTTLTEQSALDPAPLTDPYTQTKRAAYLDAMKRVEAGQDICIVISGGAYGPSPLPERTMLVPSFNARLLTAIEGRLTEYVNIPVPWVYAGDVAAASVAALTRGVSGERYLGFGRPEDVLSMVDFCNLACEIAGSAHRVVGITKEHLEDPDVHARVGVTLTALARRTYPEPWFRNDQTVERLDYQPISLDEGLDARSRGCERRSSCGRELVRDVTLGQGRGAEGNRGHRSGAARSPDRRLRPNIGPGLPRHG